MTIFEIVNHPLHMIPGAVLCASALCAWQTCKISTDLRVFIAASLGISGVFLAVPIALGGLGLEKAKALWDWGLEIFCVWSVFLTIPMLVVACVGLRKQLALRKSPK